MINKMDVKNLLEEKLLPEINKLRLLRELTIDARNIELQDETSDPDGSVISGLYHIICGVITAYQETYNEIEAMGK